LAAHNAPEGLIVGITSSVPSQSVRAGIVTMAVALHNIPEGIAVAITMMNATHRPKLAAGIATATGLVEPLAAAIGIFLVQDALSFFWLDMVLALVAGIMITVSLNELIPQAWQESPQRCAYGLFAGAALMLLILHLLGE
jgi:ZIP family zinc transporter